MCKERCLQNNHNRNTNQNLVFLSLDETFSRLVALGWDLDTLIIKAISIIDNSCCSQT